ncbi:hypothetical protein [Persicobacter diffluens]|uniref:Uncharacterized protein n=1 Tax=Persicobacter diffluens TaxID=981 RepID=A0AAN4VWP0_9BACT|nr:hypothetical protein PEDI_08550 [Persicobacter diffluens]
MTALESEILEELFFVISYPDLLEELQMEKEELDVSLKILVRKGWVKAMESLDAEAISMDLFESRFEKLYYLATKEGLLKLHGH